ncbi:MAG: hypothetical protein OEW45_10625 [Deltaproteobacteria bacterium]|nr:hypothetical protein [Deltaproteobacteria bacterium]
MKISDVQAHLLAIPMKEVDFPSAWAPEKALEKARQFAPYDLHWLEEPIWPPEDFAILAETYNVNVAPHSPYFGPGLLATAHLVAATPSAEWVEYYYANLEASIFQQPPKLEKGHIFLPEGPGLGLEIDPSVLQHYLVVS